MTEFSPFQSCPYISSLDILLLFLGIANIMISYQEHNLDAVKAARCSGTQPPSVHMALSYTHIQHQILTRTTSKAVFLWIFVIPPELSLSSNKSHALPHHPYQPNVVCASSSLTSPLSLLILYYL